MMKAIHQSKGNDLAAFSAFLAVATHRSFRSAADELNMTPSAISHSIKVLEERLNVRLFNRTTRSVSLTEASERLASKLKPAMASTKKPSRSWREMVPSPVARCGSMPAKGLSA
jgi:DNA-binding transcriptional LysR family regulator